MTEDLQKVKDLLKIRGCSDRTIANYLSCINRFKNYYNAKEVNLDTLTENDILEYLKLNCINVGFSAATINVNRAAIRYYYLVNFKIDFNKTLLPSYKVKSRFPKLITKQDFLNIINSDTRYNFKTFKIILVTK